MLFVWCSVVLPGWDIGQAWRKLQGDDESDEEEGGSSPSKPLSRLRAAVFGCGDSSYTHFNAVAKRMEVGGDDGGGDCGGSQWCPTMGGCGVQARLKELGAELLVPTGAVAMCGGGLLVVMTAAGFSRAVVMMVTVVALSV